MGTRVLDWNGLVLLATRPPAERIVSIAGVPARVKKTRATDSGIYVQSLAEEYADEKWALKLREHMLLLRQLVDAGAVTVDDDEDPWRLAEWHRRLDAYERCFVASCSNGAIDPRGPVYDTAGRMHLACPAHWEAVMAVLGAQHADAPDTVEIREFGREEPIRTLCVICGAGPDTAHDIGAHAAHVSNLPTIERS